MYCVSAFAASSRTCCLENEVDGVALKTMTSCTSGDVDDMVVVEEKMGSKTSMASWRVPFQPCVRGTCSSWTGGDITRQTVGARWSRRARRKFARVYRGLIMGAGGGGCHVASSRREARQGRRTFLVRIIFCLFSADLRTGRSLLA